MTLEHIDVALGFAVLMLLLSLLITVLVQATAAVLRLRGGNLYHGVVRLLEQADPDLAPHAAALAERVLRHPAVSHTANQRATAIRVEELTRLLADVSSQQAPAAEADSPLGRAQAALKASFNSAQKQLKEKIEIWFGTVMDRTSERFTLQTRWFTAGIALLLAGGLQIDSLSILKRLSTDSALRSNLIATSQAVLRTADTVRALTAKSAIAQEEIQARLTALNAASDSIASQLSQSGFEIIPDPYPGLKAYDLKNPKHLIGTLMTVLFISLGAPFWYNVLRQLANLRPSLAQKVQENAT